MTQTPDLVTTFERIAASLTDLAAAFKDLAESFKLTEHGSDAQVDDPALFEAPTPADVDDDGVEIDSPPTFRARPGRKRVYGQIIARQRRVERVHSRVVVAVAPIESAVLRTLIDLTWGRGQASYDDGVERLLARVAERHHIVTNKEVARVALDALCRPVDDPEHDVRRPALILRAGGARLASLSLTGPFIGERPTH